jgi:hypothetical protein
MRLDLGDTSADPHSVASAQGQRPEYNHSAYEVTDAVGVGGLVPRDEGHRHARGIGRHVLGSQLFDRWTEPWNDTHVHYADGCVFTSDRTSPRPDGWLRPVHV